jgi:hypothetical protein
MRDVGILTLLSVIATAAAPGPKPRESETFLTARTTDAFVRCFAETQDRGAAPWWFVPKREGGTFSNLGAASVSDPYFLVISDRGQSRAVKLEHAARLQTVGVKQCI